MEKENKERSEIERRKELQPTETLIQHQPIGIYNVRKTTTNNKGNDEMEEKSREYRGMLDIQTDNKLYRAGISKVRVGEGKQGSILQQSNFTTKIRDSSQNLSTSTQPSGPDRGICSNLGDSMLQGVYILRGESYKSPSQHYRAEHLYSTEQDF